MRHAARAAPLRGFTLVEVLIALTLLALLMLVLTSALRAMGQVEERVEQRIDASDDYRATTGLLNDVLGQVSAQRYATQAVDGPPSAPFFEARESSLAWIGVMPARFGLGGRHYLRLALEPGTDGASLVLRYAPWTGAPTFTAWAQAQGRVLATPVQTLSLRYLDPGNGQWSAIWPPPGMSADKLPRDLLPAAVEIQLDGPAPAWPPLFVALRANYATDPSAQQGSFGGGSSRIR